MNVPRIFKKFSKEITPSYLTKMKNSSSIFPREKINSPLSLSVLFYHERKNASSLFFIFFIFFVKFFFYLFFLWKIFQKDFFIFRLTFAEDTFLMHFCRSLLHCQVFFLIFLFFKIRNQKRYFFLFVFLKKIFLFFLEKGLTFWAPWIIIEVRRKNKAFPFRNEKNNKPFFSKSQEKKYRKNKKMSTFFLKKKWIFLTADLGKKNEKSKKYFFIFVKRK